MTNEEINQKLARLENVTGDFFPTTNWAHGGPLVEKYQIDLRYNEPGVYSKPGELWLGGVFTQGNDVRKYVTAWAEEPLIAAMTALTKAFYYEDKA